MTTRELVLNFVNQYRKPFDAELIANMTGLEIEEIEPMITELLEDKTIKLASKREPIYARSNRFNTNIDNQMRPNWYFDPQAALALLNLIEQGSYTSIRGIAEAFGRSRQWVFVYLEALASMGVIGLNEHGYCVLTKKDVHKVGIKIKPSILRQLRSHCSELRKQQNLQEKLAAWQLKLEGKEPLEKEIEAFDSFNQVTMQALKILQRKMTLDVDIAIE
jgi:DNA-binding Lrp family transcriptional regulator